MELGKTHRQDNLQAGSVLLIAIVFLLLTTLVALTTMDTSILSRKMAINNQLHEEALQIAEGIVTETANNAITLLQSEKAPLAGAVLCMVSSTDAECSAEQKILSLSTAMTNAAAGSVVYRASFNAQENSSGRSIRQSESEVSAGLIVRYVDVEGSYDGVEQGLSRASLVVGVKNQTLSAHDNAKKEPKAEKDGSGAGSYRAIY